MRAEDAWARGDDVPILRNVVWQRIPLVRLLGMAIAAWSFWGASSFVCLSVRAGNGDLQNLSCP